MQNIPKRTQAPTDGPPMIEPSSPTPTSAPSDNRNDEGSRSAGTSTERISIGTSGSTSIVGSGSGGSISSSGTEVHDSTSAAIISVERTSRSILRPDESKIRTARSAEHT